MQVNFIDWLDYIIDNGIPEFWAWKLYTFPPGHHPLIFHTESSARPEGFWWSYKLPASYYSNNTVFYHWPSDPRTWSQWLRDSKLGTSSTSVYSYKQWSSEVLQQFSPYWYNISIWNWISSIVTGQSDWQPSTLSATYRRLCVFHSSFVDVTFLYRPYYFDAAWDDWFLKTENINHSNRYGVCLGQLKFLWFLRAFFLGYWFAFLIETPWPHRLRVPRDVSIWRRFRMMRNFFKSFNLMNPIMLGLSLALLSISFVYSQITSYVVWTAPLKELASQQMPLWWYFIVHSFLLLVPLARLSKVFLDYRRRLDRTHGTVAFILVRLILPKHPLLRARLIPVVFFVGHWASICLCLTLFWALTPFWGYIPLLICKVFWFLLKGIYWLSVKLGFFLYYVWLKLSFFLFVSVFDLEYTALGEFLMDKKLWQWIDSFFAYYDYMCFYLRTVPLIIFGLASWVIAIIWPLLYPYLRKAVIKRFPWAFVTEISVKTRIKYGLYLFYMFFRNRLF